MLNQTINYKIIPSTGLWANYDYDDLSEGKYYDDDYSDADFKDIDLDEIV
jgi:hypothetical protein